jgi:cytochrome c peroxidase
MVGRALRLALILAAFWGIGLSALALAQGTATEPITPLPVMPSSDPRKVALGARLFNDVRLSGDVTRSCASCHDVNRNGARPPGSSLTEGSIFDTLTVFNAALNYRLNWEGKFRNLEAQAVASIESPQVMAGSLPQIVQRLRGDPDIVALFARAYGRAPESDNIIDALTSYERSLTTPESRFDRWLAGEQSALTAIEQRGYNTFKTLGCISCHQGMNIGGNLMQRQGIFRPLASPEPQILRVPSLRNVAVTAPYFHDGSAPTLGDAIRKMAGSQLNADLSDGEVEALVAFLGSLTGRYRGRLVGEEP